MSITTSLINKYPKTIIKIEIKIIIKRTAIKIKIREIIEILKIVKNNKATKSDIVITKITEIL